MNFPKRQNYQTTEKLLIIVGSKNPIKIASTDSAFSEVFKQPFLVNGINASSLVSDQPKGDKETFEGAKNRARNSKSSFPEADYWVGIEGGIAEDELGMNAFAWVYVENKAGLTGKAKTGTFYIPEGVAKLVRSGLELGHADDQFFAQENSKQEGGSVGILTHGVLDRTAYYHQAIILSLIPFLNEKLYTS
jgi:inosine/xanthosine triphosphatase